MLFYYESPTSASASGLYLIEDCLIEKVAMKEKSFPFVVKYANKGNSLTHRSCTHSKLMIVDMKSMVLAAPSEKIREMWIQ